MSEPVADSTIVPSGINKKASEDGVKVLLTGTGAMKFLVVIQDMFQIVLKEKFYICFLNILDIL